LASKSLELKAFKNIRKNSMQEGKRSSKGRKRKNVAKLEGGRSFRRQKGGEGSEERGEEGHEAQKKDP